MKVNLLLFVTSWY